MGPLQKLLNVCLDLTKSTHYIVSPPGGLGATSKPRSLHPIFHTIIRVRLRFTRSGSFLDLAPFLFEYKLVFAHICLIGIRWRESTKQDAPHPLYNDHKSRTRTIEIINPVQPSHVSRQTQAVHVSPWLRLRLPGVTLRRCNCQPSSRVPPRL